MPKKEEEVLETVSVTLPLPGEDGRDVLPPEALPIALCEDNYIPRQRLHRYSKVQTGIAARSSPFTACRTTSLRCSKAGDGRQTCSVCLRLLELLIKELRGGKLKISALACLFSSKARQ